MALANSYIQWMHGFTYSITCERRHKERCRLRRSALFQAQVQLPFILIDVNSRIQWHIPIHLRIKIRVGICKHIAQNGIQGIFQGGLQGIKRLRSRQGLQIPKNQGKSFAEAW